MKQTKKKSPKKAFNIYSHTQKNKKLIATVVSILIVFSLVLGVVAQFLVSF